MENAVGGTVAPKAKPIEIQPSRARTAVSLIWRKATVGYNPPEIFFRRFGTRMMTIPQVKEIATAWQVWAAAAESRHVPIQNEIFFDTMVEPILKGSSNG